MRALMRVVSFYNPLGPSLITIVFDDCPLPARSTVVDFTKSLRLEKQRCAESYQSKGAICRERNTLIVLGCIAEKFAGPYSVQVLTPDVLLYLVTFLKDEREPCLMIHALITLEKFAQTLENKKAIEKQYLSILLSLELHYKSPFYLWREVGFCARWALDNVFTYPGRQLSYKTQIMKGIDAMLNWRDMSECLKISSDGLEARSDSHSFESVRGTFQINAGCWYYEVEIVTGGVMQIGWATKKADFENHDGYGVGDDIYSLSYDGCRRLVWHRAEAIPVPYMPAWKPGDVIGCLIDLDRKEAIFSLNKVRLPVFRNIFEHVSKGFYAAASFMAHQQCRFNFGSRNFVFPPQDRAFMSMNDYGNLTDEEKKVIPRRVLLLQIRVANDCTETSCTICFGSVGCYKITPCNHGIFCLNCVRLLDTCPLCRTKVCQYYSLSR